VHQDYPARAMDAAEAVVVAVHGGVELVVAAQRHQLQYVVLLMTALLGIGVGCQLWRIDEVGFTGIGIPLALAGPQGAMEAAWLHHAPVEVMENVGVALGD